MRAMSIAATGMLAQQTNVEVIANNLANMNTTGYKVQRAEFQDLLYQNIERPGSASADTGAVLLRAFSWAPAYARPPLTASQARAIWRRPEIPMISLSTARAIFTCSCRTAPTPYTRAGSFAVPEGQLVTSKGYVVAPGIAIPQDAISVTVNSQGQVQATIAGQTSPEHWASSNSRASPTRAAYRRSATISTPKRSPPAR